MESVGQVPPRFWERVDDVCTRLLAILLPVYYYSKEIKPSHQPLLSELYQSLHDTVAYAGWLNICIQLSPTIFSSRWPKPGDKHELCQVSLSQRVYELSKMVAAKHDDRFKELNPDQPEIKRNARIKIAVAPQVTRYSIGAGGAMHGIAEYTVMKPHAVYYHGRASNYEDEKTYVSLAEYIGRLKHRWTPFQALIRLLRFLWSLTWLLLLVQIVVTFLPQLGDILGYSTTTGPGLAGIEMESVVYDENSVIRALHSLRDEGWFDKIKEDPVKETPVQITLKATRVS